MRTDAFTSKWGLPEVPVYFKIVDVSEDGIHVFGRGFSVILSVLKYSDGKNWAHLSVAGRVGLPSYRTICEMKEIFIGRDKKAISILAPESEHVNVHPNCLHLWHCIDGDGLPDFRICGMI